MRRIVIGILVLMLTMAAVRAEETADLVRGSEGEEILSLQQQLIYLGFLDGEADGKYGPATAGAVEDLHEVLRRSSGMDLSGGDAISPETITLLHTSGSRFYVEDLSLGMQGDEVLRLQRALCLTGFLDKNGKTGLYDEKTFRAVYAFQHQAGLEATGTADRAMQENLYATPRQMTRNVYAVRGDEGEQIRLIQEKLWQTGYLIGEPDGKYGEETAVACEEYLKEKLDVDASGDYMDVCLQLMIQDASLQYEQDYALEDEDDGVARILRLLSRYGYYGGEITREYTLDCQMAVRYFQQCNRLPITGVADKDTQTLLYSGRTASVDTPALHTIYMGDSDEQVLVFQQELVRLGYMIYPLSGVYDEETDEAGRQMLAFLSENGYPAAAEWEPGDPRVRQLISGNITLSKSYLTEGSSGSEVLRMQKRLNSLGYLSRLKIDGKFGAATTTALALFQKMNGLPASGKAPKETQELLYSYDAVQRQSPWRLEVSIEEQMVYAYQLTGSGEYVLVRSMICSTGLDDATPRGVFAGTTGPGTPWHYFEEFDCWAQYTFYIEHDIMFHSVIYSKQDVNTLRKSSVEALGKPASHGCVRLMPQDAEWIYKNCPSTTVVTIY